MTDIQSRIMARMADGRERTTDDLATALRIRPDEILQELVSMARVGTLTREQIKDRQHRVSIWKAKP